MKSAHSLLALACACFTPPALAQQTQSDEEILALAYGDQHMVSIATGNPLPLRRAPVVATVITAEDIAAMGATDLDQVLETVPGIHVSRSNQAYAPLYLIRGIHSELNPQTLMLQNGVPMTTLFVGNRGNLWGGLPVENIARIEIMRGPGSALHGADAFSGVINIVTKTAADTPGTEVGLRAGSFNTRDGWLQHGGKLGPLDVAAYFRAGHSDGFRKIVEADAQTSLDKVFGTHASLAPGPLNLGYDALDGSLDLGHDKVHFRAGYKLRNNLGTGAGVAGALDPVGKDRSERIHADLTWNDIELARDWKMGLAASYLHYKQDFNSPLQIFPPGAFGGAFPNGMFGAPKTWERQVRLSMVNTYSGFANHNLRFGVGHDDLDLYKTQELKNFTLPPAAPPAPTLGGEIVDFPADQSFLTPHRRTVSYVYAQDMWTFARDWSLTAGVRNDRFSDFGGTTNPRLALVWEAAYNVTAKLLYGRAFRAPAFTEEFSINNPVYRGNPNLKPETIDTLETAMAWQSSANTRVNMSLFRYLMNDIIRVSDMGDGTKLFNNGGSQRGYGGELEGIWDMNRRLRLLGHYAYQHSIDGITHKDAGHAPHHHLFARADWTFVSGWLASSQFNWVADRRRAPGDTRPAVPDYATFDLSVHTTRRKSSWEFAITLRNLFNADVREPSLANSGITNDLPQAPRAVYLQASFRL